MTCCTTTHVLHCFFHNMVLELAICTIPLLLLRLCFRAGQVAEKARKLKIDVVGHISPFNFILASHTGAVL